MNREAQEKLRLLRQRLAELEPYPWETIEAWIASAKPLIKSNFSEHFEEFKAVAAAPDWYVPIYAGGSGRWGDPPRNNIAEASARAARENRTRANNAKQKILNFVDGLLDLPVPIEVTRPEPSALHHYGDFIMGSKYTSNITGSNVGAVAVGDHAQATGTVNFGATATLTQEQHRAAIKEAQKALIDDEDKLEPLVYEALGQFLRLARDIQVEQKNLVEVQAKMKETLDEVWAQKAAEGLRPQALPNTLEVVGAIAKHPVAGEVLKKLLGT
ncbi:hypothetical protein [Sorangium sp. So ce341]|uniref:hypothetical protein n=1 Tax=Sorangium sp. So ce341 TaxID=3133302 RepID=UPI003F6111E8